MVWANPRSLATTNGITFVFSSSRYWDVSVPWVRFLNKDNISSIYWVAPFGNLRLITVICTLTQLIAAYHVLHRLIEPRHPPGALLLSI